MNEVQNEDDSQDTRVVQELSTWNEVGNKYFDEEEDEEEELTYLVSIHAVSFSKAWYLDAKSYEGILYRRSWFALVSYLQFQYHFVW